MAIGDYSKTTYINGTTPAMNATNLNNNENKTKEIDTYVLRQFQKSLRGCI